MIAKKDIGKENQPRMNTQSPPQQGLKPIA
jgi:hypothetical protein